MQRLIELTDPVGMGCGFALQNDCLGPLVFSASRRARRADTFVRIGSRIYIDPDKFHELIRENAA